MLVGGEAAGMQACACARVSVLFLRVEGLHVLLQEAEMGAASKEAAVRLCCTVNCVSVCVCLCGTVRVFVLTSVCR